MSHTYRLGTATIKSQETTPKEDSLIDTSKMLENARNLSRVDFAPTHVQPSPVRVALATVFSIGGSLLADALLVIVAGAVFPSTKGYSHFQFGDYAKLTVIGVLIACAAWPVVTRVTSSPRWLFFRLAILVSLALFAPDLWLLAKGQSSAAVGILMAMHVAIALITYNALVRLAPVRGSEDSPGKGTARKEGSALVRQT